MMTRYIPFILCAAILLGSVSFLTGQPFPPTYQPTIAAFTANGTWVVPGGVSAIRIYGCGGGGGGGAGQAVAATAGGGGGGAGGVAMGYPLPVTSGSTITVVVGTGGSGGVVGGAAATNGIASSVAGIATVGTFVNVQDGSGGTTIWTIPAASVYGGTTLNFQPPIATTSGNGVFVADATTGANVICSGSGYSGV